MKARNLFVALLFAALPATASVPAAQTVDVVEFYNATLDHYFVTTDAQEAADLDSGVHVGWKRTGLTFKAIQSGAAIAGSTPICRFYGRPEAKLDSHFYSASTVECDTVQSKFGDSWLLESREVFRAFPVDPNTGKCGSDSEQVFRLWNKRADVNHRYTTQMTVYQDMIAKGYVAEGDGSPALPVIFCMPMKDASVANTGTPACTLTSSATTPALGTPVTLTAICTNQPTQFAWTNCISTTSTCTANATVAGLASYSVTGSNATGAGNVGKVDVTWQGSSGPLPICTVSASTGSPSAGAGVTLTANCSQSPTRYDWVTCNYMLQSACNFITSCSLSSGTCTTNQSTAGLAHYAVAGTNSAGQGPRGGIDIDWSGTGTGVNPPVAPTAPVCSVSANANNPTIGGNVLLIASCTGNPTSYAWTNCTGTGGSCNATSGTAGAISYSVVATNAVGKSASASTQVSWQRPAAPSCTVNSSNATPMAGSAVVLTATCSGSPTSFNWTGGCSASGATCSATSPAAGPITFSVAGVNASGPGSAASTTVTWQPQPTAPPVCSVSSSASSPFTGQSITLTATCTNQPATYAWTNCAGTASTCTTTSLSAGSQSYAVTATNLKGASAPASVSVGWQQSTAPPDFCGAFKDVERVGKSWSGAPVYPNDYGGSFRAAGVLVVSVTVPGSPATYGVSNFSATAAEYQGPPTFRTVTLSRSPCDFRAVDKTGQSGPITIGYGNSATVSAQVGAGSGAMLPGQTWYINIQNQAPTIGLTCKISTCNLLVGFQWPR